jgi:hypothetical protein
MSYQLLNYLKRGHDREESSIPGTLKGVYLICPFLEQISMFSTETVLKIFIKNHVPRFDCAGIDKGSGCYIL